MKQVDKCAKIFAPVYKKETGLSQMLNIATSGGPVGASPLPGMGSGQGPDAPKGLFSALVSLFGNNSGQQTPGAQTPGAQTLGDNGAQTLPTEQNANLWMNLQAGDASLSISSQAISSTIDPQDMLGQLPAMIDGLMIDGLQIDQQMLQELALKGIDGAIDMASAGDPASQAIALGTAMLGIQETLQNGSASNPASQTGLQNNPQAQQQANLLAFLAANNGAQGSEAAGQNAGATDFDAAQLQNSTAPNTQLSAAQLATLKQLASQQAANQQMGNQQVLTPNTTPEQVATRDSLAVDLQRQLSTNSELNQTKNTNQNIQAIGNLNNNSNANQTQLPFVLTREIVTSGDPIAIAQLSGQASSQSELSGLLRPTQASYQPNPINLSNVAIEIARNFNNGINRFQVRLDPPELGRIDVRMNIDEAGNVNARLTVERPDTLDFLQRDVRALERALAQAGIDSSRTNLEFMLKDSPFGGNNSGDGGDQGDQTDNPNSNNNNNDNDSKADPTMIAAYRGNVAQGGLSIWV